MACRLENVTDCGREGILIETTSNLQSSPISIYKNLDLSNRPLHEAPGNKPHKLCSYSPEPRAEVYCLRLNFNISKLVYFFHKLHLSFEKNYLFPNIRKNHQKIYKKATNIDMSYQQRDF